MLAVVGLLLGNIVFASNTAVAKAATYHGKEGAPSSTPVAKRTASILSVTVTPGTVTPGERATVSVVGFAPSSQLDVSISGHAGPIGSIQLTSNPTAGLVTSQALSIPFPIAQGVHTLTVTNPATGRSAATQVTVVGQLVTVTPTTVAAGNPVTVSVAGFAPSSTLYVTINGHSGSIGTLQLTSNPTAGLVTTGRIIIPADLASGTHTLTVTNPATGRSASAQLMVTGQTTTRQVTVMPGTVVPGERVTVSVMGFKPSSQLDVSISGHAGPIGSIQLTSNPTAGLVTSQALSIPFPIAQGVHTLTVTNPATGRSAATQVTVVGQLVTVTPTTVAAGNPVTVSVAGFAPSSTLYVTINGHSGSIGTLQLTSNPTAGLVTTGRVTVATGLAPGVHTLTVTNPATQRSASAQLTINGPLIGRMVTVAPATVAAGNSVTVSVSGFAPSSTLNVTISGDATPIGTIRLTSNPTAGLVTTDSVTIPFPTTPGVHTLTVTNPATQQSASTQITITASTTVATLAVTPAATNRGGLVTISGGNFAPNEPITVAVEGVITPLAIITATAQGLLPPTGVSVPYSISVGPHTLRVTGKTSGRTATAGITVAALNPSLTVSVKSVSPGSTVTVTGHGFGRQEQVTLALDGAALPTTPSVITTANGAFTAQIQIPKSVLQGANALSAVGNQSRVSTVATLTGIVPTATTLYFAGASTMPGETPSMPILNVNAQPAHITFTFYYRSGAPGHASLDVPAHSRATADIVALAGPNRTFGVFLSADRAVTAQLRVARAGKDSFTMLGVTTPSTTSYLAEGYTGLTFHETLALVNPGVTPAQVRLRLLPLGGGAPRVVSVPVAPQSTQLVDANALLPGKSLSVIANSSQPIVLARMLTFSNNGYGATAKTGISTPATSWIFAEGTTTTRFQTFLTILNPNAAPTRVTASFYGQTGGSLGSRTITVPGLSRANIRLNDFLHASGIASVVTSDLPVVVERPEYFGSPNAPFVAGSDVFGRNGAGPSWAFPAGTTNSRSEFLLIYNPSARMVAIDVTAYGSDGSTVTKRLYVPPTVRYNVDVNRLFAGLTPEHSITLHSANGLGFVAEQTIFAPNYSTLTSTQGFSS